MIQYIQSDRIALLADMVGLTNKRLYTKVLREVISRYHLSQHGEFILTDLSTDTSMCPGLHGISLMTIQDKASKLEWRNI